MESPNLLKKQFNQTLDSEKNIFCWKPLDKQFIKVITIVQASKLKWRESQIRPNWNCSNLANNVHTEIKTDEQIFRTNLVVEFKNINNYTKIKIVRTLADISTDLRLSLDSAAVFPPSLYVLLYPSPLPLMPLSLSVVCANLVRTPDFPPEGSSGHPALAAHHISSKRNTSGGTRGAPVLLLRRRLVLRLSWRTRSQVWFGRTPNTLLSFQTTCQQNYMKLWRIIDHFII